MTPPTQPVPRLGLTREEAAASLGMSLDSFERHVQPSLRMVRLGRMRVVPVCELERWLGQHASATLDGTPWSAYSRPPYKSGRAAQQRPRPWPTEASP